MPRRALLLSTLVAACAGEPQVEVLTRSSADTLQAQAWADRFELWFAQAAALADGELDAAVAELPVDEPELARAPKRRRPRRRASPMGQVPRNRNFPTGSMRQVSRASRSRRRPPPTSSRG
ncbi:hypothetical protein OV079_11855 [Nannocystis pusilla]|uniref:Uncharacterized protein n=1 Tax=Nannocystis pusilla TaxID=889268 RepID=A0A9X3ELK3_9BACT|nr:hypothetical protein [Nannocystis pusilla]MCY1006242.1 hypothetical protein [Nannocystis pusilla]